MPDVAWVQDKNYFRAHPTPGAFPDLKLPVISLLAVPYRINYGQLHSEACEIQARRASECIHL